MSKQECGLRTSIWENKAHDLRRCGVNDGLNAHKAQETGNLAQTAKLDQNLSQNHKLFKLQASNRKKMLDSELLVSKARMKNNTLMKKEQKYSTTKTSKLDAEKP